MHRSRQQHSSLSFTKFVARLQHTFSSKTSKASTTIIAQRPRTRVYRFQLSEILYDPMRPIEYLSEIKDNDDSDTLTSSDSIDTHQEKHFNISQMNISMEHSYLHDSPQQLVKLPNAFDTARLHSTAIFDISNV